MRIALLTHLCLQMSKTQEKCLNWQKLQSLGASLKEIEIS